MTRHISSLLFAVVIACAVPASGDVLWDEDVGSDLSGSMLAPTNVGQLGIGETTIRGHGDPQRDRDFFSFSTAPGTQLVSAYIQWDNPRVGLFGGSQNFLVFLTGAPGEEGADGRTFVATLPHDFVLPAPRNNGLLRFAALGAPEPEDGYTIFLQVRAADVTAAAVPEPQPIALVLLGGGLVWLSRRWTTHQRSATTG